MERAVSCCRLDDIILDLCVSGLNKLQVMRKHSPQYIVTSPFGLLLFIRLLVELDYMRQLGCLKRYKFHLLSIDIVVPQWVAGINHA